MSRYYILEGKTVVGCNNVVEFGEFFNNFEDRVVAKETVKDSDVSTVFLGLDHRYGNEGPPLVFETMVFGGPLDQECERYSTWEEAETGHKAMVGRVLSL